MSKTLNVVAVGPSDRFAFRCTKCGACCRHVKESVPLESLDVFRIAQYLSEKGVVDSTLEFLDQYADLAILHESGYFVFFLKTTGSDDSCIFLKNHTCQIHPAKPRACRTYPIETAPNTKNGSFDHVISTENTHHFKGSKTTVKSWLRKYLTSEDRDFVKFDFQSVKGIVRLLVNIPKCYRRQALLLIMRYRYWEFDLHRPFLDQFYRNHQKLLNELKKLQKE